MSCGQDPPVAGACPNNPFGPQCTDIRILRLGHDLNREDDRFSRERVAWSGPPSFVSSSYDPRHNRRSAQIPHALTSFGPTIRNGDVPPVHLFFLLTPGPSPSPFWADSFQQVSPFMGSWTWTWTSSWSWTQAGAMENGLRPCPGPRPRYGGCIQATFNRARQQETQTRGDRPCRLQLAVVWAKSELSGPNR